MKLTLKIKLQPSTEQSSLLLATMQEANKACNFISDVAFKAKTFNQFKIHNLTYKQVREQFNLSSQVVARCIGKVADSYKLGHETQRVFKTHGSIAYDSRILSYKSNDTVSIWCIGGRQKMSFVCHNQSYLPYIKGEADLVYKNGKFYLLQTVEVPEEYVDDVESFIGCDFGLNSIVTTSDGHEYTAEWLNKYRDKRVKVRSSLQSKCTKDASRSTKKNVRRVLKRLSGRERATATIINHTISKALVRSAKQQNKGIAIEDLTHIRTRNKRSASNKKFRTKLHRWNFGQLRSFITYKCQLRGVKLAIVNPAYTSQTCNECLHIGKRNNKIFHCTNKECKVEKLDADFNASKNIALLGAPIDRPEESASFCKLKRC